MKRVAIYAFYDKNGIVDDYVFYFLKALKEQCSKIICVVNGFIEDKYKSSFSESEIELVIRENLGFDAFAYKKGIEILSSELLNYDELIICNNSFFGPIYPLTEMFCKMESKGLDFWGVTKQPRYDFRIHECQEFDYVNEHIQSYFVAFSKKLFLSEQFKSFWDNLIVPKSFLEAVCLFELRLTSYLSQCGYKYNSYVDPTKYGTANPTILYPADLLKLDRDPFIKRKCFIEDYQNHFYLTEGDSPRRALEIAKENGYDEKLIFSHLLRDVKLSDLRTDLQLNYVLSSKVKTSESNYSDKKIALILYIYYADAVDECLDYAFNLPKSTDIYLVYSVDGVYDFVKTKNLEKHFNNVTYVKKINKGRDITSYVIDCKEVFNKYDYICYFHDKRSPQLGCLIKTRDFFAHCMNSILPSTEYVHNVISLFEENECLGLLVPPPLGFGDFFPSEFNLHPGNEYFIKKLIEDLKLNTKFDEFPVAPYGDFYWVRGKAMAHLFNKNWSYDNDIPPEPIDVDGTILHALERIIPSVVQSSGYYAGWIMSEDTARIEINNQYYIKKNLLKGLFKTFPFCKLHDMVYFTNYCLFTPNRVEDIKKKLFLQTKEKTITLYRKKVKYKILCYLTLFRIGKFTHTYKEICQKLKSNDFYPE